jgi:hypothetical protein
MRGLARRHPLSQQLRVGKNPGKRIVYLVRHHGRHLADGGHLFHVQHMIVGALSSVVF